MLTQSQTDAAIRYNQKQGYTPQQIKTVQEVIGTREDGVWGPRTVQAVADWQEWRCLDVDGKVGPITFAKIREEVRGDPTVRPPSTDDKPVHGVWVDDPRLIKREKYWDEMQAHGIGSVALMFERSTPAFDPHYTYGEMEDILNLAQPRDIDVGVTDWPFPTPKWMDDMLAYTRRMFDPSDLGFPLVFHESDVEGNWKIHQVRGFKNIDLAGDRLVEVKTAVVEGTNARRESTSFTSHTENGRAADVAPYMDAVFNQGYGVRGRTKKNPKTGKKEEWLIPWNHTYGPGNMARHTFDRSMQIPGIGDTVRMGAGLAAYDQKWPQHTAQEAMMKSYVAALEYHPFEVRWWSWKWIFGARATSYGKPFLQSIMAT